MHKPRASSEGAAEELGFGGTVRQASFLLADLLARRPELVAGRSVVERCPLEVAECWLG